MVVWSEHFCKVIRSDLTFSGLIKTDNQNFHSLLKYSLKCWLPVKRLVFLLISKTSLYLFYLFTACKLLWTVLGFCVKMSVFFPIFGSSMLSLGRRGSGGFQDRTDTDLEEEHDSVSIQLLTTRLLRACGDLGHNLISNSSSIYVTSSDRAHCGENWIASPRLQWCAYLISHRWE